LEKFQEDPSNIKKKKKKKKIKIKIKIKIKKIGIYVSTNFKIL
jgi:hypothetical protein